MKKNDEFEVLAKEIEKDDNRRENLVVFVMIFLFLAIFISAFFSIKSYLAKHIKLTKNDLIVNIDTNEDNIPDLNINFLNSDIAIFNIDNDNNKSPDFNLINYKYKNNMIINFDQNNDNYPDINVDIDGDKSPEVNLLDRDLNQDSIPDLNIDKNNDGIADINIDVDGNGLCDLLCNNNIPQSTFNKIDFNGNMNENTGMAFYAYWLNGFSINIVGDELKKEITKEFIVENGSNESSIYRINLTEIDYELEKDDLLSYKVYCDGVGCGEILNNRKLTNDNAQSIFNKIIIPAHTIHKYMIKINYTSNSINNNKKYYAIIEILGVNK